MEQRERPRPGLPTAAAPPTTDGGNDDVLSTMGTLLEAARTAVTQRLSEDSSRYVRAARQHGGE